MLDAAEQAALIALGEHEEWLVEDLPDGTDADILRALDMEGCVEVRWVVLQNQQRYPGDEAPPDLRYGPWFSPLKQPHMAGRWEKILDSVAVAETSEEPDREEVRSFPAKRISPMFPPKSYRIIELVPGKKTRAYALRLTDQGRAMQARLRRAGAVEAPKSEAPRNTWPEVQRRLIEMYDRSDPYTTVEDLARKIGCSKATVQKAMKPNASALANLDDADRMQASSRAKKLQGWQARFTEPKRPKATHLNEVIVDRAAQGREESPAQNAEREEAEAWERLLDAATPEERENLKAMPVEKREELIETVRNDPDRGDRVLGRLA